MENLTYSYIAESRQIEIKPLSRIAELEKLAENLKLTEPSINDTLEKLLASLVPSPKRQEPEKIIEKVTEEVKKPKKPTYQDQAVKIFEASNESDDKCPYAEDEILGRLLLTIKTMTSDPEEGLRLDTVPLVISKDIRGIDAQFRFDAEVLVQLSLSRPVKGVSKPLRLASRSKSSLVPEQKVESEKPEVVEPVKKSNGCVIN